MKIHEYNEMMAYLLRPASLEEKLKEIDEKYPGSVKPANELPPVQDPFKDFEDRNPRETAAQGGVIGEDGMFKGEDMGTREGFKKLKKNITKEKFIEEYKIFQESKNNIGLDSEFADYLNKNYTTIRGKEFNIKNIQKARSDLGVKTKVGTVPPSVQARFNKINAILPDLVKNLNSKEKYVTKEQLSSMIEKKLNIPGKYDAAGFKISQLDLDNYPIVRKLDKVPDKIEKTLKNMLTEDKPLNDFFMDALQKRVGVVHETIATGLKNSRRYRSIADKGAYDLRFRFNKNLDHSFLKKLSFSDQLKKGIDMREGQPMYTKMGDAKRYGSSPKNKVMEFAIRSWNVNQGKGPVKFFDKKTGQRITWNYGKKLPYREISFSYNGKKFNAEKLNDIDVVKKSFPEVYKNQIAINKLSKEMIDDPFKKGSKISVRDLIKEIQINAYEWSPKTGTLDLLHGPKGVGLEPFTNLNYNTKDINQIELGLSQGLKSGALSQSQVNQTLKLINKAVPSNPQSIIARQTALVEDYKKGKLGSFKDISEEIRALTEAPGKTKLEDIKKVLRVAGIKSTDEAQTIINKINKAPLPNKIKKPLIAAVYAGGVITGADFLKKAGIGFDKEFEQTASAGETPLVEKGLSTGEQTAIGAGALGTYAARKPILKTLGKVARPFGFPSVAAGFSLSNILDYEKPEDASVVDRLDPRNYKVQDDPNLKMAGLDLLLPELIKKGAPKGSGIMSMIGRGLANPFGRAARVFTPVGATLTAAGIGKDYYDFAKDEIAKVKAMSPEERNFYNDLLMDEGGLLD